MTIYISLITYLLELLYRRMVTENGYPSGGDDNSNSNGAADVVVAHIEHLCLKLKHRPHTGSTCSKVKRYSHRALFWAGNAVHP